MNIIHLKNKDIDYKLWDSCISESKNLLIYAYSWYLDVVSPYWEALVSKDYEFIMPLPVKIRFGIPYLVQPILTQQLGVFSKQDINENIVSNFTKEIPYFSYELNLNEYNFSPKALILPNFVLDLNQTYNKLYSSYSKNTQRNIQKASKLNLRIQNNIDKETFLSFFYSIDKHFSSTDQSILKNLINIGISFDALNIYAVYSNDNKLIAGLCLLKSSKRITYLLPVSSTEGKISSAMFLLIDYIIQKYVGNKIILDFEGSKIEGVARFYNSFGAKDNPYYVLKRFRPSFLIGK